MKFYDINSGIFKMLTFVDNILDGGPTSIRGNFEVRLMPPQPRRRKVSFQSAGNSILAIPGKLKRRLSQTASPNIDRRQRLSSVNLTASTSSPNSSIKSISVGIQIDVIMENSSENEEQSEVQLSPNHLQPMPKSQKPSIQSLLGHDIASRDANVQRRPRKISAYF